VLRGDITSASSGTAGCQFHPRCPVGEGKDRCASESPVLAEVRAGQLAACHFPTDPAK